jgi:hypothetical protein
MLAFLPVTNSDRLPSTIFHDCLIASAYPISSINEGPGRRVYHENFLVTQTSLKNSNQWHESFSHSHGGFYKANQLRTLDATPN